MVSLLSWLAGKGDVSAGIIPASPTYPNGAIDGMPVNPVTPAAVSATTVTATSTITATGGFVGAVTGGTTGAVVATQIELDTGTKTATASSGAATLNKMAGIITSEALSTAAGATYTLTLTNSDIAAVDQVFASVNLGAGTGGTPTIASVAPGAGSVVIIVQNIHSTVAFNAAIKIIFAVFKN